MPKDPLYQDDRRHDRMAGDAEIMARIMRLQWVKLATGALALGLSAAIWPNWRFG